MTEQIFAAPAHTVAGVKVQARLLHQRRGGAPGDDAEVKDRLTQALLSAVLSMPVGAS